MKNSILAALLAATAATLAGGEARAAGTDLNADGMVDAADVQAFLKTLSQGGTPDPSLDLDGDKAVGLEDALLYGRWVNGLWEKPEAGFTTLYFRNPADEAVFKRYQDDLKSNRAMTMTALKSRYPERAAPVPGYAAGSVEYADRVGGALSARNGTWNRSGFLDQVHRDGMAVSSAHSFPNYFQALDFIHSRDLPLLFTTDALLHTVFLSYDNILIELEVQALIPALDRILLASREYLLAHHGGGPPARDVGEILETALLLLKPLRPELDPSPAVEVHLANIRQEAFKRARLFGRDTVIDFSQFKPRGHYTRSAALSAYFKAMMWLSRADLAFDLRARNAAEPDTAVTRMKRGAWILWDCVVGSGSYPAWLEMNRLLEYMVGMSDGLSVKGMGTLAHVLSVRKVQDYLKAFDEAKFDAALAASGLGAQAILSQGRVYGPGAKEGLDLPPILSFMPQRFALDSYTFSQVVHPEALRRAMPSSLDIAFALGDNSALADMAASPAPAGILASQRALYDGISAAGWRSNLYTSWLDFLRQLNPADNSAFAPAFRTAAWNRKMRNTQLASWAQLRHNTILYTKQSYTGGAICEFPRAYVEPYPAFFSAVAAYSALGKDLFKAQRPSLAAYFATLEHISSTLAGIAGLTAQGRQPTDEQVRWLQTALSSASGGICGAGRVYDGWYRQLIYGSLQVEAEFTKDYTIADVHTKPYSDEIGPAQVLHAATGTVNLMAAAVKLDTCVSLFVGPVSSFHDVNRVGAPLKRMTNAEWTADLEAKAPHAARPPWTRTFMGP